MKRSPAAYLTDLKFILFIASISGLGMGIVYLFPNKPVAGGDWFLTGLYFYLIAVFLDDSFYRIKGLEIKATQTEKINQFPFQYAFNIQRTVLPSLCIQCGKECNEKPLLNPKGKFRIKTKVKQLLPAISPERKATRVYDLDFQICSKCYDDLQKKIFPFKKPLLGLCVFSFPLAFLPWVLNILTGFSTGVIGLIVFFTIVSIVRMFDDKIDKLLDNSMHFAVLEQVPLDYPQNLNAGERDKIEGYCTISFTNDAYAHALKAKNQGFTPPYKKQTGIPILLNIKNQSDIRIDKNKPRCGTCSCYLNDEHRCQKTNQTRKGIDHCEMYMQRG